MRKYEKKEVTEERKIFKYLECDMCKKRTNRYNDWSEKLFYDVNETEIRYKTGAAFPEGGSGTEIEIDLCPECFKNKLIPWLKENGCVVSTRDWDY